MAYCYLQYMMAVQVKNSNFQMNHFYCLPNTATPWPWRIVSSGTLALATTGHNKQCDPD